MKLLKQCAIIQSIYCELIYVVGYTPCIIKWLRSIISKSIKKTNTFLLFKLDSFFE